MTPDRPSPSAALPRDKVEGVTALVLSVFRAHGALLAFGDALVAPLELSSARWQVLGAIALAGGPLTVPAIARSMGLSRQAVQKQVDRMLEQGLVELEANSAHRRSSLVALTSLGRRRYRAAIRRWMPAAGSLGKPHALAAIAQTQRVLDTITEALTSDATEAP
jgi:DNA-binding MarR family transcriptional regulator